MEFIKGRERQGAEREGGRDGGQRERKVRSNVKRGKRERDSVREQEDMSTHFLCMFFRK